MAIPLGGRRRGGVLVLLLLLTIMASTRVTKNTAVVAAAPAPAPAAATVNGDNDSCIPEDLVQQQQQQQQQQGGKAGNDDGTAGSNTCQQQHQQQPKVYPILGKPDEFSTSTKGYRLAVRRWIPKTPIKAVVLFHHGGAGFHSGYSDIMGRALSQQGIAVIAYDQIGSGYSEGLYRNYFDSIDTLCDDYTKVLQQVRSEYPNQKVFAMGESFGGFVILAQSIREQEKMDQSSGDKEGNLADGYILTGPMVKLLPEMLPPKPAIRVATFLAKFFPMLTLPGTDMFSTFDLAFGDPVWAQTGRNDPMIQEAAMIAPRLGMIASVLAAIAKVNQSFASIRVPLKILTGEKESRVDTNAIRQLAQEALSLDKDLEIVPPGAYHQLFQDLPEVTSKVCESVQSWVLQRA